MIVEIFNGLTGEYFNLMALTLDNHALDASAEFVDVLKIFRGALSLCLNTWIIYEHFKIECTEYILTKGYINWTDSFKKEATRKSYFGELYNAYEMKLKTQ